jgi:hypothetical protein
MTPMQQYGQKRDRVKQAMEGLGFTDVQVDQIMTGLKPDNIDGVIATLEQYEREDDAEST